MRVRRCIKVAQDCVELHSSGAELTGSTTRGLVTA